MTDNPPPAHGRTVPAHHGSDLPGAAADDRRDVSIGAHASSRNLLDGPQDALREKFGPR
jgi:hypothetical protein